MLYPRIIMLLVTVFCAGIASILGMGIYTIPLPALHYIAIIAMSIFALAGVATFIGSFSMRLSRTGVVEINDTTYLGKKMNAVIEFGAKSQTELHCCDVYVASTKATAMACFAVSGSVLITCFAIDTFWLFVIVVFALAGFFALLFGAGYLFDVYDNWRAKNKTSPSLRLPSPTSPIWIVVKKWTGNIFLTFFAIVIVLGIVYFFIIVFILEIMALGYTWYAATGIYLLSISIVLFPAFCIGGKKLVQRLPFADSFCPIVARKY